MALKIEQITIGYSELTDSVFAGVLNKEGNKWLQKVDVTNAFLGCVISRWENKKETIRSGDNKWEITVKKL